MIVVAGHFRIPADRVEEMRPHARENIAKTRAEDGCLLYAYGEDVLEPGLIRVVERWTTWAALEAHGRSVHIAAWREALNEIGVIEREIRAYETEEERPL